MLPVVHPIAPSNSRSPEHPRASYAAFLRTPPPAPRSGNGTASPGASGPTTVLRRPAARGVEPLVQPWDYVEGEVQWYVQEFVSSPFTGLNQPADAPLSWRLLEPKNALEAGNVMAAPSVHLGDQSRVPPLQAHGARRVEAPRLPTTCCE